MLKFKLASETHFKETFDQLTKYAYPPELNSLFAFTYKQYFIKDVAKGQDTHKFTNPDIYDPVREYNRVGLPGAGFRITNANQDYKLCPTYPSLLVIPEGITDDQLKSVATFRSRGLYYYQQLQPSLTSFKDESLLLYGGILFMEVPLVAAGS